ncbi:MAG: DUF2085 domain-containing protein [Longibaculum sp.]
MIQLINLFWERLLHFGSVPLCNGIASRAPHILGVCFPLCYRCTFIFLLFIVTFIFCYKKHIKLPWWMIVLGVIVMTIDGGLQTFFGIMSTNLRRSLTGGLFGIALGGFVTRLFLQLDKSI